MGGAFTHVLRQSEGSTKAAARVEKPVRTGSYFLFSAVVSLILFGVFLVSDKGFLQVRSQRQELARMQSEISTIDAGNRRLEEEITALQRDPRAVEKIAREELRFARPDEVVLFLPKGWREKVTPSSKRRTTISANPAAGAPAGAPAAR